jgi:hypothetical protein
MGQVDVAHLNGGRADGCGMTKYQVEEGITVGLLRKLIDEHQVPDDAKVTAVFETEVWGPGTESWATVRAPFLTVTVDQEAIAFTLDM